MFRKTQIDHCTTTSSMSSWTPLSLAVPGLSGQAWPSLANAHVAEFTHLFTQEHTSQTRASDLDPAYPSWQSPPLTLRYDSRHCHGSPFLRELKRSAESSKSALTDPPPKETSSLDLHLQERSDQADATSIDDMHTVYCHTHSIITSSNTRADEWGQSDRWGGLLSRLVCKRH